MRFIALLPAPLLPLSVLAMPVASPLDVSIIERREPDILPIVAEAATPVQRSPDKILLVPRQNSSQAPSLSNLLGDLLPALRAVGSLLNSETIENVKTTIDGLAEVLGNGRAGRTGTLLDQVGGLVNEDLINSIKDVLPSIGSLLTKENADTISNLLGQAGGLLTEENVKKIETLVNNANSLLTENFVRQTVGLINDVAPLVSAISQIITTLIQAVLGG